MTEEELIETEKVHESPWIHTPSIPQRPIRTPHFSLNLPAFVGGTEKMAAGEVSLAHNGILVLDEFNEWPKVLLKALRGIVKENNVKISRLREAFEYPANFLLVGKSKPCPCGRHKSNCGCAEAERRRFAETIAEKGKNLFDITHWIGPFNVFPVTVSTDSETIRKRVIKARQMQAERLAGTGVKVNGKLSDEQTEKFCVLPDEIQRNLEVRLMADKQEYITERIARVKRLARTIADLDGSENIDTTHVLEALSYYTEY